MPVYVHVIDHPDGRVLVDTGIKELHPATADLDPRNWPLDEQDFDLLGIDIVVNTHLHFDHCGATISLPASRCTSSIRSSKTHAARRTTPSVSGSTLPALRYVPVDGEFELLPGLRLVPAPGHTPGTQIVVIETGSRPVIVAGDAAVWFGELDEPHTEGQMLIRALGPELVWLSHTHQPWRPRTG